MFAIESLGDGFGQRLLAGKIRREHRRPRDGLQRRPVQPRREDERKDDENFSAARKHEVRLSSAGRVASRIWPVSKGIIATDEMVKPPNDRLKP